MIKRVRSGDEATRAVVLLYERTHKARKSVIAAAETSPSLTGSTRAASMPM